MLGKKIVTTARKKGKGTQKKLTQLHLAFDDAPPALRACSLCGLTYTVGAPDDEALHRTHCARVQRGLEWGREEERERERAVVTQIRTDVRLKDGRTGRIVCFRADAPGRVGAKVGIFFISPFFIPSIRS
jgi:N-acetyltransferase